MKKITLGKGLLCVECNIVKKTVILGQFSKKQKVGLLGDKDPARLNILELKITKASDLDPIIDRLIFLRSILDYENIEK